MGLAIGAGSLALVCVVAVFVLALKLSSARVAQNEAVEEAGREKSARLDAVVERDREHAARAAAEQRFADEHALRVAVEMQRDELSEKLSKALLSRIAVQPASQDGADAVNELFEQPLGRGPK